MEGCSCIACQAEFSWVWNLSSSKQRISVSARTDLSEMEILQIIRSVICKHTTVRYCMWWFNHYVVSDSCDSINCSRPGSSVHGISQARILEWVAISFSRGSPRLRNRTQVSCLAGRFSTDWGTKEAQKWGPALSEVQTQDLQIMRLMRIYSPWS